MAEERIAARAEESSEPSGNEPFVADTPAEQESSLEVAAVNTTWAELELLKRQDPACQVIPFCDLCARVFETPCLQFGIMTESRGSSVRVYVDIWEDGEYVCGFAAECSSSDTTDCDSGIIDCEGDRGAEFMMNRITYWNDDAGFGPIVNYLDLVVDDDIFLCCEYYPRVLRSLLRVDIVLLIFPQRRLFARVTSGGQSSGVIPDRRVRESRARICWSWQRTAQRMQSIARLSISEPSLVIHSNGKARQYQNYIINVLLFL